MSATRRLLARGPHCDLAARGDRLIVEATTPAGRPIVEQVASLHGAVDHAHVPAPVTVERDRVELELAALGTLSQLLERAREQGETLDYGSALGLGSLFASVWSAIRRAEPTRAAGTLCGAQIVLDVRGAPHFIGIGTGLVLDRGPSGALSPFVALAPEIARGDAPALSSDVYAAAAFAMQVVPFLRFPAALSESLSSGAESPLGRAARYFESHVATHVVAEREADLSLVLERFASAWAPQLRWSPDDASAQLAQVAMRLLAPTLATLEVAPDASWAQRGLDAPVDLSTRAALRGILDALVDDRHAGGAGLDFDAMASAGWPGEKILDRAARARVHTAVSTLRKLVLGEWLEHEDGRYRIAPAVSVSRREA